MGNSIGLLNDVEMIALNELNENGGVVGLVLVKRDRELHVKI